LRQHQPPHPNPLPSRDVNAAQNYWGTINPSAIDKLIYDFNDDFNLGKVNYTPFLTEPNSQAMPDPNAPISTPKPEQTPTPTPVSTTSPSPSPSPSSYPNQTPSPDQSGTQPAPQMGLLEIAIAVLVIINVLLVVVVALLLRKRR
jgi:hypothetical protein